MENEIAVRQNFLGANISKCVSSSLDLTALSIGKERMWHLSGCNEERFRKSKKVWSKQQALILASKVDRKTINDLLLKEQDVFSDTPKYLAVTKRLYRPFADQYNFKKLDEST